MVRGTIFFPTGWSRTWIDDTRITALASEQISWPVAETYVFIDPATNITYRARTTGTERNTDGTPKLKLKDGKPQINTDDPGGDAALKRYVSNLEVMHQLVSTFVAPLEETLPAP